MQRQLAAMADLDFQSPRVRAAMTVLGIMPREVMPVDKAAFGGNEMAYKHYEQKRKNMIEDVKRKVSCSPDVSGKSGDIGGETREARNAAFMAEVERNEQENMALMQKLAKKDVQKVVIQELEQKAVEARNKKRQQEGQVRMKKLLQERDDDIDKRKKEAQKKQDKIIDVRTKAQAGLEEKAEENLQKLLEANARAEKKIKENKEAEAAARVENSSKRVHIFERQAGYEAQQLRGREDAYAAHVEKHTSKMKMLQEVADARQSNAEEIADKQRRTSENVKQYLTQKQAKAEERYWNICERHENAGKFRDETLKTTIKEFQVRNQKRWQSHSNRYDRLLQEFEKDPGMKLCASSAPGSPKFVIDRAEKRKSEKTSSPSGGGNNLARTYSDSVLMAAQRRQLHEDTSYENRQRLRRAHHYAVEQQLDKLHSMRQKVEVMTNSKTEADKRRSMVVAKCSREKMHLQDRVDRIKDSADPDKMYNMLEDLNPDEEAVTRINELLGELGMQKIGFVKDGDEEGK